MLLVDVEKYFDNNYREIIYDDDVELSVNYPRRDNLRAKNVMLIMKIG